ncbi:transglycosylase domain-containing protein [Streptomyces sp. NBC_01465]|uniref:transglycosylase domain-containing protein n=1 Tax=Streptomyces sp. NBC_01465 TaxID=2903878 RepID=UPI002E315AAB|nr:transglycosylase domain-containing protein [Streptomyces sp. NBC_01465]
MSEHRRKPPQPQGGGRAADRRAAPQPSGRRAAPTRSAPTGSPSGSYGEERPYGGRAEARRAAQRGGGGGSRRRGAPEGGPQGPNGPGGRGGGRRGGGGGGRGDGFDGPAGRGRRPSKKRMIDYPRANKYGWRRWMPSWKLVTGTCIGFTGVLLGAATIAYAMVSVPNVAKTATAQNNVYYWADGSQMVATGGEVNRQIIPYDQIPKEMRFAVMSAENKTFETDSGIDPQGIARALLNMAKGGETQGGSTITQQYVKNAQLDDQSQTISRKFKELFISIKVGTTRDKKEIMAGYLNTAYYGRGAYGIQAAARTYFHTDAKKLNVSQCAFLSSLLKGATYYDPAGNPGIDTEASAEHNTIRVTARWKWTLDEMVKDERISAEDRAKYKTLPHVDGLKKNAQLSGQTGYLVDLAKSYVQKTTKISANDLSKGGYQIYTTFDKKKVEDLEAAVKKVRKEKSDPKRAEDKYVQFGGASVDVKSGAIVAIYGGENATTHFTNNADVTGAQVGSTFKPFVLAAALRDGKRDPDDGSKRTIVSTKSLYSGKNDLKIKNYDGSIWEDKDGKEWLQENDDKQSVGRAPDYAIDLREAMRESVNSAFVQLGMDVGTDKVKQAAVDAGLTDDRTTMASDSVPSFSIGTSSPSAIRMAGAYSTFANNGQQNEPFSVKRVAQDGVDVYNHETKTKSAFSSAIASNVTDVLKTVVDKGTGTSAQLPDGREVAGKTGTTDENKSAWFVGYTPQLSTAIDMYRLDDTHKVSGFQKMYGTFGKDKIHGASFPAEIWHDYMTKAMAGQPELSFPSAEDLGEVVYGGGLSSPEPTPTIVPTPTPSPTPSIPTPSFTPTPTPTPTSSCSKWDWTCNGNSTTPTPSATTSSPGNNGGSNGNGNGGTGVFGGTTG